ncbi:hypothetical protein HPB49_012616 [Dermacentor silvarum]|uniref:Uncharacterized protein n=1 Tax=Dermacentor silvarum TaxID=543639 RepID=A0ACB8C997_DERSI|nr:hypothetical protein HPB49_012616 [Dermacentor silvarum]
MSDVELTRPEVPRERSPPFSVIAEDSCKVPESKIKVTKSDDNEEDTTAENDLLTTFVPLLISMKILGIGLSLSDGSMKKHSCPLTLDCTWKLLIALLMLTYAGHLAISELTWGMSVDTVSNVVTTSSALVVYVSMHKSANCLGSTLRKLTEDGGLETNSSPRERGIFLVTFGAWAMQGLTIVSKLARCYAEGSDSAAADCLRGNETVCTNPAAVVNLAEVAVRYGLVRGSVWMSMLLAYYMLVNIDAKLKRLNMALFQLQPPELNKESLGYYRRTHCLLCRAIKVVDTSFSVCSFAWYTHSITETLASVDQLIAFVSGDLWCLPFRVFVALNAMCLPSLMLFTSEAAHCASKQARDSVVLLSQRSAEMHQPEMYEQINATLNSFRRGAATVHCCRVWPLGRAGGLLALLTTTVGVGAVALCRPASRAFLRAYMAL